MEFSTYTHEGLAHKLFKELKGTELDTELIGRINAELKNRSLIKLPQMSYKEQIYWILKDTDFEKIHKTMEALDWKWAGGAPTITELIREAEKRLIRVAATEQDEQVSFYTSSGGFHTERCIHDGVMCLSLKFVVSDWTMDYDAVTSDNYSDTPYEGDDYDSIEAGTWDYRDEENEEY